MNFVMTIFVYICVSLIIEFLLLCPWGILGLKGTRGSGECREEFLVEFPHSSMMSYKCGIWPFRSMSRIDCQTSDSLLNRLESEWRRCNLFVFALVDSHGKRIVIINIYNPFRAHFEFLWLARSMYICCETNTNPCKFWFFPKANSA